MISASKWANDFASHWDLSSDIRMSLAVWIEKIQEDARTASPPELLPKHEKLVFWIMSNRGTDVMQVVQRPRKEPEALRKDALETWCEDFGAWSHGDNVVRYGWCHYRGKKPIGTKLVEGERARIHRARKIREEKLARKRAKKGTPS